MTTWSMTAVKMRDELTRMLESGEILPDSPVGFKTTGVTIPDGDWVITTSIETVSSDNDTRIVMIGASPIGDEETEEEIWQ